MSVAVLLKPEDKLKVIKKLQKNIKEQSFWMKNCLIPLDIIMMVDNQVTKIHHNCPPCKEQPCDSYRGNGNQVLELKGGESERLGIREGDILEFT